MDISSDPVAAASIQPLEGSKPQATEPKSEEFTVQLSPRQSSNEEQLSYQAGKRPAQVGMMEASQSMREKYTGVQNDLLKEAPDLLEKDWDFSVDEKGELVIIEGEDKLTESEINKLKEVLEDNDMGEAMNTLTEHIINWGEASRGPEGFVGKGDPMGTYDVNKENVKDIIFGRELMNGMEVTSDTKLTDGQTNHYASKKVNVGWASVRETQIRAVEAYNESRQPPLELIESQLVMRAEARY